MVIFASRKKILAFLFGGYKKTSYLCNRQNIEDYFSNEGKMISSPELIKLRWAYFYAHIAALLQRRYGGCLPVI